MHDGHCAFFNGDVNELMPVCLGALDRHEHVAGLHLPRIEADGADLDREVAGRVQELDVVEELV